MGIHQMMILCILLLHMGKPVKAMIEGHLIRFVPDGDGLLVRRIVDKKEFTTRLCGIDCPELGQGGEKEAQRLLESLVSQGNWKMHVYSELDIHGRTVITLMKGNTSAASILLRRGVCVVYPAYVSKCIDKDQLLSIGLQFPGSRVYSFSQRKFPIASKELNASKKSKPFPIARVKKEQPWDYRRRIEKETGKKYFFSCKELSQHFK